MNYEEKYKEALERAKIGLQECNLKDCDDNVRRTAITIIHSLFPELNEGEDEEIRKALIDYFDDANKSDENLLQSYGIQNHEAIAWLEKQGNKIVDCPQNHQDVNHPNGGIVMEDFNGGEGFYKLHLDYLNKKQVEEVEEMVRMWNKESKTPNEDIKNCIGMCLTDANEQRFKDYDTTLKDCLKWLEKQGQVKESHISQHESKTCEENNEFLTNEDERNLAWSEEDEQMVLIIEQVMNCASLLNIVPEKIDNIRSWLKSLRPQKQWKSNEKQGRKKDFALIESKFKKKVDADEVIDWIKTHGNFWPVVTIEINKVIAKFKKDFKL